MHGNVAYCRKHGHDWRIIEVGTDGILVWQHSECTRCGLNNINAYFEEDDE